VNLLLLELHALRLGLLSRWWGTFNQWHDLGCRVCRRPSDVEEGHWGCRITYYHPLTKTVVDSETGDKDEERYFCLKTFTVFAADQVEGEKAAGFQVHEEEEGQPHAEPDFQPAEELIAATKADIRYGGNRAYYARPLPVSLARLARTVGYANVSKGFRKIDAFERTGRCHPVLFARLSAALGIDETTRSRLAYEDYKDWLAAPANLPTPYLLRSPIRGCIGLPEELTTVEEMERYAADHARRHRTDVCLVLGRRIWVRFAKDGSLKEVVEAVPPENPT
jgi:hypothetical protein